MVNIYDFNRYIDECRHIYDHLADEESRYIFNERLLHSLTGDTEHARNLARTNEAGRMIDQLLETNDNIYIFGAGAWGREIAKVWPGKWKGFLDNDQSKWGNIVCGVKICSPKEVLSESFSGKVLISSRLYYQDISDQLIRLGLTDANIINVGLILDRMAARQYFSLPVMPHAAEEVFADVGSLDAKTALQFIKWSGEFSKIYCFEPDVQNAPKCRNTMTKYIEEGKAEIIEKAAWSTSGTLHFSSVGNGTSAISDEGISVGVTTLDSVFKKQKVTFIKMDIEGAELEALRGSANLIRERKPKLAICVYHKPEDIISLPSIILEYNSNYKLYLRHYSVAAAETVLYAI